VGPGVSEREEEQRTLSDRSEAGPWAAFRLGPKGCPAAFLCFFFVLSFRFLFSLFFHNFFKIAPNQIKPNPEVF
jgi:hypothetical protein